ncbi:MAG: hypothetical protein ACE5KT_10575 [Methanosarcinales archaeon]
MLADSSTIINLQILGLDSFIKDLDTVVQIKEELPHDTDFREIYVVSAVEVEELIKNLEKIALQTDKPITIEIEKTKKRSNSITLCPLGKKGTISLHYGEFYLLARAINRSETILCDDDAIVLIKGLLSGICGIDFNVMYTLEFLHKLFLENELSAEQFATYFEEMINTELLHIRLPAKNIKDKMFFNILHEFIWQLINTQHTT